MLYRLSFPPPWFFLSEWTNIQICSEWLNSVSSCRVVIVIGPGGVLYPSSDSAAYTCICLRETFFPPPPYCQCRSMSLTGTGCSCQAVISVLIGPLVATSAPTPTSPRCHWPFHNTNIPTVTPTPSTPHPQAPGKKKKNNLREKHNVYFRCNEKCPMLVVFKERQASI